MRSAARSITVTWPSGKVASIENVPEGVLLTVFENPSNSPTRQAFTTAAYRVKPRDRRPPAAAAHEAFALAAEDADARPDSQLRVYTTLATWCPACKSHMPLLRRLDDELSGEKVEFIAVPVDDSDDSGKLAEYAREWRMPSRVLASAPGHRSEATAAFSKALGQEAPLPSSVVTDSAGHVLSAQTGVPSVSALRRLLHSRRH
jgi:thiol-disulfide isomerase/thioredoxin